MNPTLIYIIIGVLALLTVLYALWLLWQNVMITTMAQTGTLLEVVLEKDTETTPLMVEQMWSSFYNGLYIPWHKRLFGPQPYMTFEIKSEHDNSKRKKEITFNIWVPTKYASLVRQRITSLYKNAQVQELEEDYMPDMNDGIHIIQTAELGLSDDSAFSIKTLKDYDEDPLNAITSAMSDLDNREIAIVQVVARPIPKKWRKRAGHILNRYEKTGKKPTKMPEWVNFVGGFFGFIFKIFDGLISALLYSNYQPEFDNKSSQLDKDNQKQMFEKVTRNAFSIQVRIMVGTPYGQEEAQDRMRNIIAAFKELDGPHNGFQKEFLIRKNKTHQRMKSRFYNAINNDDIVSTFELAGFCHLPNKNNFTQNLKKVQSIRTEFSADISMENAFAYAVDKYGNEQAIGLETDGRMRHVYCSGMTGVGKSTILENMIVKDIEAGNGVVVKKLPSFKEI